MKIKSFAHKGLKKFYEDGSALGLPSGTADKLGRMFAFLDAMESPDEIRRLPTWKAHLLTGNRKGTWSLSVTANQRLTFGVDEAEREIINVNLEDYH